MQDHVHDKPRHNVETRAFRLADATFASDTSSARLTSPSFVYERISVQMIGLGEDFAASTIEPLAQSRLAKRNVQLESCRAADHRTRHACSCDVMKFGSCTSRRCGEVSFTFCLGFVVVPSTRCTIGVRDYPAASAKQWLQLGRVLW